MSADLGVMLNPTAAYSQMFAQPAGRASWTFWRRPLFLALVLGCMVSLLTLRSLSLRLVLSSMAAWAFVPLFEIGALMAVWRTKRATVSLPAAVDLFFTGHGPWSLWSIGLGAFGSWFPDFPEPAFSAWECSVCAILVWSWYIDLCFFRCFSARPVRDLLVQRAISWSLFLAVWGGGWLPSDILGRLGL